MKTFNDLNFRPYGYETKVADKLYESKLSDEEFENTLAELSPAKNAVMHFPNGWGSVLYWVMGIGIPMA